MVLSSAKVVGLAIKFGIESVDRMVIGVDIEVGAAALSLCEGYVNVRRLVVDNPDGNGFTTPYLLKADQLIVKLNIWKLVRTFGGTFEITALDVVGVEINLEKGKNGGPTNLGVILNFLKGEEKPLDKQESPAPPGG